MEEWKEYTIGEIADVQTGPFGSQLHEKDYVLSGTPIVTVEHLGNRKFTTQNLPFVSDSDKNRLSKYILKTGDLVFSRVGSVDRCTYTDTESNGWLFSGRCLRVRSNSSVDSLWLYYFFCLDTTKSFIRNIAVGATMPSINTKLMCEVPVKLPPLPTQQKIAAILSSLDDKIELNNKINTNLEQQAQAIFKNWFVDFELFGGKMPEGWKVGKLGEFVEIKRGGSPRPIQKYLSDTGYRWLKISDVTSLSAPFVLNIAEHIKEDGLSKTVFLKSGSLVLSNSATPGIPKILDLDTCIHDGWLYFPKSQLSNEYLYLLFKEIRPQLVNLGNGSIFTNLKTDILKNFEILLPSTETLSKFQDIIKPIFEKVLATQREIKQLETLRDTLLPKLMNGEIY